MLPAQEKQRKATVKTIIKSWQLPAPAHLADTVEVDTAFLNLPMRDYLNDYSISNSWNGNMISPVQSRIYFRRLNTIEDIFAKQYQPYILTAKDVRFYNSTVPYSRVAYKKGFTKNQEENEINFFFTGNITPALNLGVEINYLTAMGHYASQEAKLFNSSVFGSYNGEHYSLHAAVTFNNLSNFENGGLQTVADLNSPLQPEDLPVLLNGMSGYRYISGFLNHSYSIGMETERVDSIEFVNDFGEKDKRDTIIMEYTPLITFAHDFETNNSVRRYIERTPQAYFPQSYYNQQGTHDSTNVLNIVNTLSVTFEEAFNKVLRFGATVYARNECQRYMGYQRAGMPFMVEDLAPFSTTIQEHRKLQWMTDTLFSHQWTNNTFIGGSIYKKTGRLIRYDVTGDVCLAGYKIGEFNVDGHIDAGFRVGQDSMTISARAFVRNETPSWYLQHFESNHFRWDNDFGKTYRFYVGGRWAYPTTWVKPAVDVGFENITRYIYFDKEGMAQQHEGNIQVISADAQVDLTTPWINLENHVVYQHSSSDKLPLPTICLYHNLYYHGSWAHKAMDAQIGVDMRYFTRYYAPMLNPATGQFCVQDSELIGNYPVLNVYASFYVHLLQLRFFAQYTHINHLFMRDNLNYMTMPSYPMNPDVFRAGLSWHFLR